MKRDVSSGYSYCAEKFNDGTYIDMYRRKGSDYEQYVVEDDKWEYTTDALRAYNGEIFTLRISEDDALETAQRWRKNYLKRMEKEKSE